MYISRRALKVRNVTVAAVNGLITLVILLIAPLGLAAVWINTALVALASYATATASDRIIAYLQPASMQAELLGRAGAIQRRDQRSQLDR